MSLPDPSNRSRFGLVTAAYHFLLNVLPFREPESLQALADFVTALEGSELPSVDVDAVLLRCLTVLNDHTGGRLPSLVDTYLLSGSDWQRCSAQPSSYSDSERCVVRFSKCVEDVLRYHGIRDGLVQGAIALVSEQYADSTLTGQVVARSLGLRLSTLCVAFKRQMGHTLGEHIRDVRLDRAATLLAMTDKSIKEIWSQVGYNYPANFARAFKRRFSVTAREYRARVMRPVAHQVYGRRHIVRIDAEKGSAAHRGPSVLIVDDDESTTRMIGAFLHSVGFVVLTASTGSAGLVQAMQGSPRAILLDYHLSDMDGLEFLRHLRQRSMVRPPAVVMFTADWSLGDRSDEIEALGAIVASKLCDLDHVQQLIVHLTDESSSA